MSTFRQNVVFAWAAVLIVVLQSDWSGARAQGKDGKKDSAQTVDKEAMLKSLDENRLAIEKLNARFTNVEESTKSQRAEIKEVLKAIDALKIDIAKSQGSAQPQQAEIKDILKTAQDTKHLVESLPKPNFWKDLSGNITGGLFALIVALVSIYYNRKIAKDNQDANMVMARENQKANKELSDNNLASAKTIAQQNIEMARRTLQEKAREEERKRITQKIDEFCGPFLTLREQSKHLYFGFFLPLRSKSEHEEYKDKKEGKYRTVIALLRGHKFQGVDGWFLAQIVEIGKQCADLIESKTGMFGVSLRRFAAVKPISRRRTLSAGQSLS